MDLFYEYQSPAIRDEYSDTWPQNLACVPRTGDCIQGTDKGNVLKVMAVTLQSHHRVLITLGMDRIGHSDPVFKDAVPMPPAQEQDEWRNG
jgi:hypothetical protein